MFQFIGNNCESQLNKAEFAPIYKVGGKKYAIFNLFYDFFGGISLRPVGPMASCHTGKQRWDLCFGRSKIKEKNTHKQKKTFFSKKSKKTLDRLKKRCILKVRIEGTLLSETKKKERKII